MSSILNALEKLDFAVNKLDKSVSDYETRPSDAPQVRDSEGNVVDVDFVARRLDGTIKKVESLLREEG